MLKLASGTTLNASYLFKYYGGPEGSHMQIKNVAPN